MTSHKIKLDRRAVREYLRRDPALRAALLAHGRAVAGRITGARVAVDATDRAVVRVINDADDALVTEADTGEMTRALNAEADQ